MNGNVAPDKKTRHSQIDSIVFFLNPRLMLRNKADRATRALLREISRDNVDLFSSFESTRSVPTRASSVDSSALGIISPALKLLQFTYFGGFFYRQEYGEDGKDGFHSGEAPGEKGDFSVGKNVENGTARRQ